MVRARRVVGMVAVGAIVLGFVAQAPPAAAEAGGATAPTWAWRTIDSSGAISCGVREDGAVKCWGVNGAGQLGQGDTEDRGDEPGEMGAALPPVDLGPGRTAVAVSTNAFSVCALLDDGSVKCWGDNGAGQLGQGDTEDRGDEPGEMGAALPPVDLGPGRTALQISVGNGFVCALLDNQSVKCWGANSDGQLGVGDTVARGDQPGEMGANLPAVDLGTGRLAIALSADGETGCAIREDHSLVCWGNGYAGQLGSGLSFHIRGDGPGEMGEALPAVDLGPGRTATAVSVGRAHVCSVLDDGTVKCWGLNGSGRLGLGDTASRGDSPGEMGAALPAVDLGPGRTAVGVASGFDHSCAVLDDGTLRCWGANTAGELGLGDTDNRGDGPGEMGPALASVDLGGSPLSIAAGNLTSCALLGDGSVRCWGGNPFGGLGLGDTGARGDEPGEMGTNLPAVALGPMPAPSVRADYRFLRSRKSSVGSAPDLVDVGPGVNVWARERVASPLRSVLRTPEGNGLDLGSLSSVVPRDHYTVAVLFRLDEVDGYRRLVNFAETASDNGLYVSDGALEFFPQPADPSVDIVDTDEWVQVTLTRTRVGRLRVFLDGAEVLDLDDTPRDGVVAAGDILRLFVDDPVGQIGEESSGAIARLRLWDRPLTPGGVAALGELPPAVAFARLPATAAQQAVVRVTGANFGPLEQVRIQIRDQRGTTRSLATPRATRSGRITRSVYVPAAMADGPARITATGLTSQLTRSVSIRIT